MKIESPRRMNMGELDLTDHHRDYLEQTHYVRVRHDSEYAPLHRTPGPVSILEILGYGAFVLIMAFGIWCALL